MKTGTQILELSIMVVVAVVLASCEKPTKEVALNKKKQTEEPVSTKRVAVKQKASETKSSHTPFGKVLKFDGLSKLDASKNYLIVVTGKSCSASSSMEEALQGLSDLPVEVVTIDLSDVQEMFAMSTPWLWLYKDGRIVDGSRGSTIKPSHNWEKNNQNKVLHLLSRNGIGGIPRPKLITFNSPILSKKGQPLSAVENRDMSDLDLSGFDFNTSVLSGTVFDNSNLEKSNLSGTLVVNTSFLGANLQGADLHGSYWENTVCPDGSNSNDHGFTCVIKK